MEIRWKERSGKQSWLWILHSSSHTVEVNFFILLLNHVDATEIKISIQDAKYQEMLNQKHSIRLQGKKWDLWQWNKTSLASRNFDTLCLKHYSDFRES